MEVGFGGADRIWTARAGGRPDVGYAPRVQVAILQNGVKMTLQPPKA